VSLIRVNTLSVRFSASAGATKNYEIIDIVDYLGSENLTLSSDPPLLQKTVLVRVGEPGGRHRLSRLRGSIDGAIMSGLSGISRVWGRPSMKWDPCAGGPKEHALFGAQMKKKARLVPAPFSGKLLCSMFPNG
jgi:hypothetical protein